MMKTRMGLLLAAIAFASLNSIFVSISPVSAADTIIKYGDVITGNLTDKQASVVYTFDAKKGDVIAVEFTTIATAGKSLNATFQALNTNKSAVVYGSSGLFASPDDETYTATISDIAGDGKFVLKLIQAQPLTLGKAITGTVSYDKDTVPTSSYYYFSSKANFVVKLDTPLPDPKNTNTVAWGLVVREHNIPPFDDYTDVYNYSDNMNTVLSTAVTLKGSDSIIALGVRASGYSLGDSTKGASQDFTLTVTAATP